MPRMPGFAMPYVDDLFRAAGSIGMRNRGVNAYGGMQAMDRMVMARGKKRMAYGAGGLLAGGAITRSAGSRGLKGRSSGSMGPTPYGSGYGGMY